MKEELKGFDNKNFVYSSFEKYVHVLEIKRRVNEPILVKNLFWCSHIVPKNGNEKLQKYSLKVRYRNCSIYLVWICHINFLGLFNFYDGKRVRWVQQNMR